MSKINVVNYHITMACNYRCKFCFSQNFNGKQLDFTSACLVCDKIKEFFAQHNISDGRVNFAGGEPLLYKDIFKLLAYCQSIVPLLGRVSTSSQKYQDDVFNDNAMPPILLNELGKENLRTNGAVEAYIYRHFTTKHDQLSEALAYCLDATKETFDVSRFISSFWKEAGLKRSIDKVFEIVVYALFSALVEALSLTVEISVDGSKKSLLHEFDDFGKKVMCLDFENPKYIQTAKVYRVGVTNAADRGLDMYSNWGPAIQIKHLTLDETLAEGIVGSVSSDRIVIVCKDAEKKVIISLLNQIGWRSRIQSIITETDLITWYEKALRGKFGNEIGSNLISISCAEIAKEFPSVLEMPAVLKSRNYETITDDFWKEL